MLWNVDLTLVDVAIVTREAYAASFQRLVGRPLNKLAPPAGRSDSEVIFETLAFNGVAPSDHHLPEFFAALGEAFEALRPNLRTHGRALPGAKEALAATAQLTGVIQSVLTGAIKTNTIVKMTAFGLHKHIDFTIGGYGDEVYPHATLLQVTQGRAAAKYGDRFDATNTVLIGDAVRDVQAARMGGASMIAVATGRATAAELQEAGADVVLPGLAGTQALVHHIDRLTTPVNRRASA